MWSYSRGSGFRGKVRAQWILFAKQPTNLDPFFFGWLLQESGFMRENFTSSWSNLREGKVWTLLTPSFSQFSLPHLLVNMVAFLAFARPVCIAFFFSPAHLLACSDLPGPLSAPVLADIFNRTCPGLGCVSRISAAREHWPPGAQHSVGPRCPQSWRLALNPSCPCSSYSHLLWLGQLRDLLWGSASWLPSCSQGLHSSSSL